MPSLFLHSKRCSRRPTRLPVRTSNSSPLHSLHPAPAARRLRHQCPVKPRSPPPPVLQVVLKPPHSPSLLGLCSPHYKTTGDHSPASSVFIVIDTHRLGGIDDCPRYRIGLRAVLVLAGI